jgi:hypothetical protein
LPRPGPALQVLRCSLGDIYTLDKQKLSGKGVVAGSNFRVVPLEEAQYRWLHSCLRGRRLHKP